MMATEGSGMLKKLKSEVTCPLCLEIFNEPKRLPCEHVYCRKCLRDLVLRSDTGREITCPECRRDTAINNDVSNFSTPHQVNRLIEIYQEGLKYAQKEEITLQPATCEVHNSQPLNSYCEACEKLVCRKCIISCCAIQNHKHGSIEEMVLKYQTTLDGELEPIKVFHQQISKALKVISEAENGLQHSNDAKLQHVNSTFDTLSEILEQERRHFIESATRSFQEQLNLYSSKKREISDALWKLETLIQSTEQSSLSESFLADMANIKRKIEHSKKEASNLSTDTINFAEVEMELWHPSEFRENCHVKNFSYAKGDLMKFHFERSVSKTIPANKTADIIFHFHPEQSMFRKINSTAQLHCCHKNSMQEIIIKEISPCKYSLSFMPRERGKHKLHIKYNNEHIWGSPFPVYISMPPENLKKLSSIPVSNACGIKCHGGKIYATSRKHSVVVLDYSTKSVEKTIRIPGVMQALVDNEHIYATDTPGHKVIMMDMNGSTIKFIGGTKGDRPGQFNFPNGIQLSKDNQIYVCDTHNHRIQVFNRDLSFVRVIGRKGVANECLQKPSDLHFDESGSIYVAEQENHRIQVLTPGGQHIHHIGNYGNEPGELDHPISVAIHNNMVYVTEENNKRISVFKLSGEFVTTFGEDCLTLPECIAIDENGYVRVTDDRSRIITF